MNLVSLIGYVSTIVWIFPIFRQYNTRMFYFFLILGIGDPITLLGIWLFNIKPGLIHSIAALPLFYSLNLRENKYIKLSYTDILVLVLFISMIIYLRDLFYLPFAIHFLIFARIIQFFIVDLHQKSELNIFYLILVFYEITLLINFAIFLSKTDTGLLLFYITLAFQILIAIFFTIFREDDPRLSVKLTR